MVVRLTMICCGATEATRRARFPGDEPLEARAVARTPGLADMLGRIDRVWTSPFLRARQTAQAIAPEAETRVELRDQDFGEWAEIAVDLLKEKQPETLAALPNDPEASPPGGESFADVHRRTVPLMNELVDFRGHTVAVTHPAVVRAAIVHALGAPLSVFSRVDVEPLSLADFRSDGRRWVLRGCGMTVPKRRTQPEV